MAEKADGDEHIREEEDLIRVILRPSVADLTKPAETNLQCHFASCEDKTFKHRPALNMHLTELHGVKVSIYNPFTVNIHVSVTFMVIHVSF